MYSTRLLKVLFAALSVFAVAHALLIEPVGHGQNHVRGIVKRQGTGTGGGGGGGGGATTPTTPTTPPTSPPTTPPTSTPPTTTRPTTTPTPTTTPPESPTTPTTPTPPPSETPTNLPPSTITSIVTTTAADGSPTQYTTKSVTTPTLAAGGGGGTSGMPQQTRDTIIGVVVGVGGAIILAVIALVAWRVWGRKKPVETDTYGDAGTGYAASGYAPPSEKTQPGTASTGRSPFQSTLESYHAPTQVNTASNF